MKEVPILKLAQQLGRQAEAKRAELFDIWKDMVIRDLTQAAEEGRRYKEVLIDELCRDRIMTYLKDNGFTCSTEKGGALPLPANKLRIWW